MEYFEICHSRSEAMKRELAIKSKKSKVYILKLIGGSNMS